MYVSNLNIHPENHSILTSRGFSLVELMVAVLIGVLILNGVLQVVASSKRSSIDQREIAFIQENARYAIDVLSRDIRLAGYRGCSGSAKKSVNTVTAPTGGEQYFVGKPGLQGFTNGTHPNTYSADVYTGSTSDSILIRRADPDEEFYVKEHSIQNNTLVLDSAPSFKASTPLVISHRDCRQSGLFAMSSISGNTIGHASSTNNCSDKIGGDFSCADCANGSCGPNELDTTYLSGSRVMPLVSRAYYIGKSSVLSDMPALKREVLMVKSGAITTVSEELALGIEDMQIQYGIDTDGDFITEQFVEAGHSSIDTDWANVRSVKVTLTLRSEAPVRPATTGDDGLLRQTVSNTIQIRNQG